MKRTPIRRRSLKSRSAMMILAHAAFNAYIRTRDAGLPCISCGNWCALEAGHYRSIGAAPELRFDEENVNGQCNRCNTTMAGNRTGYQLGILDKYGRSALCRLDANREAKHYTVDDLREIREKYVRMRKEIESLDGGYEW